MAESQVNLLRQHAGSGSSRTNMRGGAIILALLVVALIATLSASMLWQQWRVQQTEAAERSRMHAGWVLLGALDWARLILAEDGRAGGADHLAEPWAVRLEEAKLTSFIAQSKNESSDDLEGLPQAFFSGQIFDAQGKLNVRNLVEGGKAVESSVAAFQKLFDLLAIPSEELALLVAGLRSAGPNVAGTEVPALGTANNDHHSLVSAAGGIDNAALMPQSFDQLTWLGIKASTLAKIEPYVTLLPTVTNLNINTASPEAIYATIPKIDMAGAQRLVTARQSRPFASLSQVAELFQQTGAVPMDGVLGVATRYFEVQGRLRIDSYWIEERSLVRREGMEVSIIWRHRGSGMTQPTEGKASK